MALSGTALGTAIKDAVIAEFSIAPANQGDLERWAEAVGTTIVTYFKANAELDLAKLTNKEVTGTIDVTAETFNNGLVTDDTVTGGIK